MHGNMIENRLHRFWCRRLQTRSLRFSQLHA